MIDFRIVQARSILTIFSIAPIRGFSPPSIVVIGERLNTTSEILYNGILVEEYVVASPSRLIVRIPPTQVGKDLTDLKVFSSMDIFKGEAALVMELSLPPKKVSGLNRLVQSWMMVFLTTPGSDVFTPQSGGGARAIIGSRTDRKGTSAAADLSVSVQRTEAELLKLQSKNRGIPPEERLLSASLESISTDESSGTISARVHLRNMVNQAAEVSLS